MAGARPEPAGAAMHFRVITFLGDPARLDDGIAYVRDEAQPEVDRMPGNLGLALWVERESGRSVTATAWTDRAAVDASEGVLSTGVRAQAGKHLGGDPVSEVYERAVAHLVSTPRPGCWTRSTRFAGPAGAVDEMIAFFEDTAWPVVQGYDGLVAAVLLVDRERGRCLSAVTFDSREAMEASRDRGQQVRQEAEGTVAGSRITDVSESELVIAGLRPPPGD